MPSNNTNNALLITGLVATAAAGWLFLVRRKKTADDYSSEDDFIYMDYNGTTPVYPEVIEAMMPYLTTHFGNPNSSHMAGDAPRAAVDRARQQILCDLLGCARYNNCSDDKSIPLNACVFTACGTESDNLAIHFALQKKKKKKSTTTTPPHVVTCNVEHAAIDGCLKVHELAGRCKVTAVPVQTDGRVLAREMIAAIQSDTVLVTLMLANNESGALQPVKEVSEYCRKKNILFATDAAQAVGKVSVTLRDLGDPDMISIVGHKIGAPKGIACLYVRPGCLNVDGDDDATTGLLVGGGQEFGRRGGTENVPYIVGLGVAASNCAKHLDQNKQHMETMRYRLLTRLEDALGKDNVRVNGPQDPAHRLPNTLSIGFAGGVHSGKLLAAVRDKVAASAGATCHAATGPVSAVLQAMEVPEDFARATVRLSLGPKTTPDQVDRAAAILAQEVKRQQRLYSERVGSNL